MFDHQQFRKEIIKPVLTALSLYSQEAEDLLIGTMAQESRGGTYLRQLNGIALGAFQMEPRSHDDLWQTYLPNQPKLVSGLLTVCRMAYKPTAEAMIYHLNYAVGMAMLFYHRKHEPIPKDLEGQAAYYKRFWNTDLGKATVEEYIANYTRFIGEAKRKK